MKTSDVYVSFCPFFMSSLPNSRNSYRRGAKLLFNGIFTNRINRIISPSGLASYFRPHLLYLNFINLMALGIPYTADFPLTQRKRFTTLRHSLQSSSATSANSSPSPSLQKKKQHPILGSQTVLCKLGNAFLDAFAGSSSRSSSSSRGDC